MTEELLIDKSLSMEEQYDSLLQKMKSLLHKDENIISNLANFTAALKQSFDKISWVGFYLFDGKKLYLGPFQGKVACTVIELGKGVCGTAAENRAAVIVPDVTKFPGHIACDADAKSEIVIPLIKDGNLYGVLDLDSTSYDAFDYIDKKYLEIMCSYIAGEII